MLKNWDFMRVLRAGMALWAFYMAFSTGDWMLLFFGVFFGYQAWFNIGCCGTACAPRATLSSDIPEQPVHFEEIK
jgi:hypothetical protein